MKWLIATILVVAIGILVIIIAKIPDQNSGSSITTIPGENMQLSSFAFADDQPIPDKYTCQGENISPPLQINSVPSEAKSLVLIVDDPDAPSGTFTHWTVWNIDAATTDIDENTAPPGAIEGVTSYGSSGYKGPCPPSGKHRYVFTLYALSDLLKISASTEVSELKDKIKDLILEQTSLVGTYQK